MAFLEAGRELKEAEAEDPVEAELLYILSEADNLRLELAKMQEKIGQIESALEPLQLEQPATSVAAATWVSAGLGPSAELEDVIIALENWTFTQPNYESLTAEGWLTFLYEVIGNSFRNACNKRRLSKIDLEARKDAMQRC